MLNGYVLLLPPGRGGGEPAFFLGLSRPSSGFPTPPAPTHILLTHEAAPSAVVVMLGDGQLFLLM